MNIGVSIYLREEKESLWTNGIKQNAIYLVKLLKEIGHNAYLVNHSEVKAPYENKVAWDLAEFPVRDLLPAMEDTDILILLGAVYANTDMELFKSKGKNRKIIKYVCGNNYILDAEASIFNRDKLPEYKGSPSKTGYAKYLDEVWLIPQQEYQNLHYLRVLYNLPTDKIKTVPFIWDPMFIDIACGAFKEAAEAKIEGKDVDIPLYTAGKDAKDKKLVVYEPNVNIIKWAGIPILIAEDYLNHGGVFDKLTIASGDKLLKQEYFPSVLKNTTIFNIDPIKINFIPRKPVTSLLAHFGDVVISHQWDNPLNYAYLDALYLNFPLVHNAHMIQDAGYYYEGFNIEEGRRQLEKALTQHDRYEDKYMAKNEDVLTRYSIYNEDMLDNYRKLLDNVMEPGKWDMTFDYNWKTNTYL